MKRNVLLIGGAGYIGSVVCGDLLKNGYGVRCFDLLIYGNDRAINDYRKDPNFDFVRGDIADRVAVRNNLNSITDVVILAGLVGDPITKKYPEVSQRINIESIKGILEEIEGLRLNRVIFVSTCSNYGVIPDQAVASEDYELKPLSLYANAKVEIEKTILSRKRTVDYHPTVLRFATAFGLSPRMRFDLTVNEFTREIYLNRELLVYDAETWRPYCHVKDFARIINLVLEAPARKVSYEIFNAGSDANNFTKQMIIDEIRYLLPAGKVSFHTNGGDRRNYRVSFCKIRECLGFEPTYGIADGVRETLAALKSGVFGDADANRNFYGNYEIHYGVPHDIVA